MIPFPPRNPDRELTFFSIQSFRQLLMHWVKSICHPDSRLAHHFCKWRRFCHPDNPNLPALLPLFLGPDISVQTTLGLLKHPTLLPFPQSYPKAQTHTHSKSNSICGLLSGPRQWQSSGLDTDFPAKLSQTSTNQGSNFASSINIKWEGPFSKVVDRRSTKSVGTT